MSQMPLLEVKNLHLSFAGKAVVHGIDFSIAPGEKLALVGESGSGKTVTALSLLRLVQNAAVTGQAHFDIDGKRRDLLALNEHALRGIRGQDIAMIFQEPMTALNPLYSIGSQIAEVLQLKKGLSPAEATKAAIKLLADTGIQDAERRTNSFPHQLSGGQRQRAMIAMALACQPKLLLADEPTTALDVTVRGQILDLLAGLQVANGMAVLLITHDLNLVKRFADRIAVMELGRIVEQGTVEEVFSNPQHAYTRKLLASRPERDAAQTAPDLSLPRVMLAKDLKVSYPITTPGIRGWFKKAEFVAVQGANFEISAGQTLGVIGESGSGKSSLALAALGLHPHGGQLQVAGRAWSEQSANNKELRRIVQVVFQDPFSSLSPRMTVHDIVGEGLRVHHPHLSAAQRQEKVVDALHEVGLHPAQFPGLLERYPHEFSGGQRQRLAIARALILRPQLLVLDEPTSALDVTIQKQVLQLLQGLQREYGLSYLLITHDVDVIKAMAHQVLVMKDGQVIEQGSLENVITKPKHAYTRTLMGDL
ncbi:putative ABC transporter ATP-binding protein YejF [Polaromonas vacuolata]|uniref:Putative ABC transporter ATP-binding protein YejF n=1 Tax=Polaromonas vacuolata TaxID=37448 RepID=A0A6H2H9G0_9BURK|nr:dipeptide ABC transporter ATP-binding protein [Polaromonas vacuolata]QJC56407.1 putative ABC transporter ATP-binding protein YejF [Polaromonas vacuolata]